MDDQTEKTTPRKLTRKQEKFVDAYVMTGNAYQSSIAAGYNAKKEITRRVVASETLAKPYIAEAIAEKKRELSLKTGIDELWIVQKLKDEAELVGADATSQSRIKALQEIARIHGFYEVDNKQRTPELNTPLINITFK